MTCANFHHDVMTSDRGSALTGFCPYMQYNDTALSVLLCENGVDGRKKGKRRELIKLLKRYNEQEYFRAVFAYLRKCSINGPIQLQVGSGKYARIEWFLPMFYIFVGDNEGSGQWMCIKSCKCFMSCRFCMCPKPQQHFSGKHAFFLIKNTFMKYKKTFFVLFLHMIKRNVLIIIINVYYVQFYVYLS